MIRQISVFLENNPGSLFLVTDILAKADVDIRAITISENSDFALLRVIVNDTERAVKALTEKSIATVQHDVIGIEVEDKPGGLAKIVGALTKNRINIEYIYPLIARSHKNAFIILRTYDTEKAEKILSRSGFHLLDKREFYKV